MEQETRYLRCFDRFGEANPNVHIPLFIRDISSYLYSLNRSLSSAASVAPSKADPKQFIIGHLAFLIFHLKNNKW
jgi:hypothetical protein